MAKGLCSNCGRPSKYRLCPACFLEGRKRQLERTAEVQHKLNIERKNFLYGN